MNDHRSCVCEPGSVICSYRRHFCAHIFFYLVKHNILWIWPSEFAVILQFRQKQQPNTGSNNLNTRSTLLVKYYLSLHPLRSALTRRFIMANSWQSRTRTGYHPPFRLSFSSLPSLLVFLYHWINHILTHSAELINTQNMSVMVYNM